MFTLPFSLVADVSANIPQSQRRELTILQSCLSLKLAGSGLCNAAEPLSEQTHHQVETASTCQLLFSADIKSVSALLQLVWSKPALLLPNGRLQCSSVIPKQSAFINTIPYFGTSWLYMRYQSLQSAYIYIYYVFFQPLTRSCGCTDLNPSAS